MTRSTAHPLARLGALGIALFLSMSAMAIEEPKFATTRTDGDFSVRNYAPMVIAEVEVEGSLSEASSAGFRKIAGYIFGNNRAKGSGSQSIAMTAPVAATPVKIDMTAPVGATALADGRRFRIHFVMPSQYTLETLPAPVDPSVKLKAVPASRAAVVRFSGFTGDARVEDETRRLRTWVAAQHLREVGAPTLARYNPPWTLPFLRRNEIILPIE
jgi:SOUL heme-binding protein